MYSLSGWFWIWDNQCFSKIVLSVIASFEDSLGIFYSNRLRGSTQHSAGANVTLPFIQLSQNSFAKHYHFVFPIWMLWQFGFLSSDAGGTSGVAEEKGTPSASPSHGFVTTGSWNLVFFWGFACFRYTSLVIMHKVCHRACQSSSQSQLWWRQLVTDWPYLDTSWWWRIKMIMMILVCNTTASMTIVIKEIHLHMIILISFLLKISLSFSFHYFPLSIDHPYQRGAVPHRA